MIADEPIESARPEFDAVEVGTIKPGNVHLKRRERNAYEKLDLDPTNAVEEFTKALNRTSASAMLDLVCHEAAVAENVATPVKGLSEQTSGYHFGAERERVIRALRCLADDLEGGGTVATEMTFTSKIKPEEFLLHTLSIEFVTRTDAGSSS